MTEISERSIGFEKIEEWVKEKFPGIRISSTSNTLFIHKTSFMPMSVTRYSEDNRWRVYQMGRDADTLESFETIAETLAYVKGLIRGS